MNLNDLVEAAKKLSLHDQRELYLTVKDNYEIAFNKQYETVKIHNYEGNIIGKIREYLKKQASMNYFLLSYEPSTIVGQGIGTNIVYLDRTLDEELIEMLKEDLQAEFSSFVQE